MCYSDSMKGIIAGTGVDRIEEIKRNSHVIETKYGEVEYFVIHPGGYGVPGASGHFVYERYASMSHGFSGTAEEDPPLLLIKDRGDVQKNLSNYISCFNRCTSHFPCPPIEV